MHRAFPSCQHGWRDACERVLGQTTFCSFILHRRRSAVHVANTVYKTNILIVHIEAAFPMCIASGITLNFSNSVVIGWFIASMRLFIKACVDVDGTFFISSSSVQVDVPKEQRSHVNRRHGAIH